MAVLFAGAGRRSNAGVYNHISKRSRIADNSRAAGKIYK
jgi:hypothetical protein